MIDFAVRRDCVVAAGRRLHRRQPSKAPGSMEMETAQSLPRPGGGRLYAAVNILLEPFREPASCRFVLPILVVSADTEAPPC